LARSPLTPLATASLLCSRRRKKEVKPLAEAATALADAREASSGHVEIVVGLDIPDGTAMHISQTSAEEIALRLAVFVTRANDLSEIMKTEVQAGRVPLGRAVVTLEKDGGLTVRWLTESAAHEKRLP
jgi:hypothetical protein